MPSMNDQLREAYEALDELAAMEHRLRTAVDNIRETYQGETPDDSARTDTR